MRRALAITAALSLMEGALRHQPALAQDSGRWGIEAEDGGCSVVYGPPTVAGEPHRVYAVEWSPGRRLSFTVFADARAGAEPLDPVDLSVGSGNGTRLQGKAEHKIDDKSQVFTYSVEDRKDAASLLSGDLTFAFREPGKAPVAATLPLGRQLPRIRQCMSQARAQARQLTQAEPTSERSTARARAPSSEPELRSTGSGFFVNGQGQLLTNAHVVDGCSAVGNSVLGEGKLLAVDTASDLALLQFNKRVRDPIGFRAGALKLGEPVMVAGYPLSTVLENGLNITGGNVSALSGPGGDRRYVQFTAPIQPGNSGGPLLDSNGRIAGVVVATLGREAAGETRAQNINWAVAPFVVQAFLDEHNVTYAAGRDSRETSQSIAAKAKAYTVPLECWG